MKIAPFHLERYFAAYEFNVAHLLCASDCQSLSQAELLAGDEPAREEFLNLRLGYTESLGAPSLRAAICGLYEKQTPDTILVCAGAQEAIFLCLNVLLSAGDQVIVQFPAYQSLYEIPRALGCRVTLWSGDPEKGWRPELDFLKDSITDNTRAIILNSPHNPTGYQFTAAEFGEIVDLARKKGSYLFCDEVYRFLEYSRQDLLPAAADLYERAVSLGVMSKSFGLAGLRIGWLAAGDSELRRQVAAMKDYTSICAAAPAEWLAEYALKKRAAILRRNLAIVRANLDLLRVFMAEYEAFFSWVQPRAGCLALPRLNAGLNPTEFFTALREKHGLLLAPGDLFGLEPSFFRLGFGRLDFPAGLEILRRFLAG